MPLAGAGVLRSGSASQMSKAAPQVIADNSSMISRNDSVRCARLAVSLSLGSSAANRTTMIDAMTAASAPLPPSSNPKARLWEKLSPHSRVARINGAQNSAIVVIPQYPYKIASVDGDGIAIVTRPPTAVDVNATVNIVRAGYLSASGPPNKYAAIATTP